MNYNYIASQAQLAIQYKNIKLKIANTTHNLKFNKDCLRHDVKPNYVHIKINNNSISAKRTLKAAERMWMKNEIKNLYRKKEMLNTLLYKKHIEFANKTHPALFECLLNEVESSISRLMIHKKSTLKDKMAKLISQQKTKEDSLLFDFKFYPRTINMTNISFNNEEMSILDKGLNYNLPKSGKSNIFSELINSETAIKSIPDDDVRNATRLNMSAKINRSNTDKQGNLTSVHRHEYQVLKILKDKLTDNEALLCKADKGHSTVVLYKHDYISKVNDFIESNSIETLSKDPTKTFHRKIKSLVNKSNILFTDEEIKYMRVMNPKAPTLHGLPKVHKDGVPIRPLIDYTTAPTYKIATKLEKILKQHIVLANNFSLKNSYDLIEKTKNLKIEPHHLLASFDVVNLYTNVPVLETLQLVQDHLQKSELLPEAIDELMTLLKEILKQNYFQFNGKYYNQTDGLAMGSPLSGLLSDIYLNHVENQYIFSDNNKLKDKIITYHRYVDDTLLIFNGNIRQLENLQNYLNKISHKLKFTLETETCNKLNFLDLTIEKTNNRLDFSIYRKPTSSSQTIHSTSYHPYSQKLAAYNSMVHRLLNTPLNPTNYSKELNTIKYIATANGFKRDMIDRLISKHKNKRATNITTELENTKYICVEYSQKIEHGLKKTLNNYGIKLAFHTNNKIRNILRTKDRTYDKYSGTGVYKLKCEDCQKLYIGQTGRAFNVRYKEHHPDPKLNKQRSTFAQHILDENHTMGEIKDSLEVLHVCRKGNKLDTLEEYEIYKHLKRDDNNVLNEKLQFSSHSIFNSLIKEDRRQTADKTPSGVT